MLSLSSGWPSSCCDPPPSRRAAAAGYLIVCGCLGVHVAILGRRGGRPLRPVRQGPQPPDEVAILGRRGGRPLPCPTSSYAGQGGDSWVSVRQGATKCQVGSSEPLAAGRRRWGFRSVR